MRIKLFLIILSLFTTLSLNSTGTPTPPVEPAGEWVCNAPYPTGFRVKDLGTSWVKYVWNGNGGFAHRIRTYRASDNTLLNTTIAPAGATTATVNGLPSDTDLYARINAICSNGEHGGDSPDIQYHTPILDLLAVGYSSGSETSCTIRNPNEGDGNSYCEFLSNNNFMVPFRVCQGETCREFSVSFDVTSSGKLLHHVQLGLAGNDDSSLKLFCDASALVPCTSGFSIRLFNGTTQFGSFTLSFDDATSYSKMTRVSLNPGYTIERRAPLGDENPIPGTSTGNVADERTDMVEVPLLSTFVSPNPFTQTLDVVPAKPAQGPVQLQLLNLSGQAVLTQRFDTPQEVYNLQTANLSPGFYLLRMEADGEVEVLKVVKQ